MSANILTDSAQQPSDSQVKSALGPAWEHLEALREATAACEQEWRHYGKKYGWKLKVHADDKVLFELTVAEGRFLVAMALREKERQELKGDPLGELMGATSPEGFLKLEVSDGASSERALAAVRFVMARRAVA